MNRLPWMAVAAISSVTACNYTVGECYYRDQGNGSPGVGGGVVTTGGVGAFGNVPPSQPQAGTIPAPDCNIANQSPCNEKCLADYENAAVECGKIAIDSQRRACQDAAHAAYKNCGNTCQQIEDCLEACKEQCDRAWEKCRASCPKGDKNCMNECSQENGRCLKECDKRCK